MFGMLPDFASRNLPVPSYRSEEWAVQQAKPIIEHVGGVDPGEQMAIGTTLLYCMVDESQVSKKSASVALLSEHHLSCRPSSFIDLRIIGSGTVLAWSAVRRSVPRISLPEYRFALRIH